MEPHINERLRDLGRRGVVGAFDYQLQNGKVCLCPTAAAGAASIDELTDRAVVAAGSAPISVPARDALVALAQFVSARDR